jgi:hypothetical protein
MQDNKTLWGVKCKNCTVLLEKEQAVDKAKMMLESDSSLKDVVLYEYGSADSSHLDKDALALKLWEYLTQMIESNPKFSNSVNKPIRKINSPDKSSCSFSALRHAVKIVVEDDINYSSAILQPTGEYIIVSREK